MSFYLREIRKEEDLKELFITKFNWDHPQNNKLFLDLNDNLSSKIEDSVVIAQKDVFKVNLIRLKNIFNPEKEIKKIEREILSSKEIKKKLDEYLFIFEFSDFKYFDFVKGEKVGSRIRIKRFSITPENRNELRTASERLAELKLDSSSYSHIKTKIEEAFSVEAVTDKFYQEYISLFKKIRQELSQQKVDLEGKIHSKLRDFIHLILNRIMFLYFVQKRGCFGGDKNFLYNFWNKYKENFYSKDKFHKEWLDVLFFESLAKPSWLFQERNYLGEYNQILKNAPYLNGGLFEKDELDNIGWKISDKLFDEIFDNFFEKYNFTVTESTPFEIEIAIDPEMLGNIYEHLVSIDEIEEEQAKAGIFYTP